MCNPERRFFLGALVLALVAAGVTVPRAGNSPGEPPAGVREFMEREGGARPGMNKVVGVVSHVFADRHMIGLIDIAEFRECKVVTCAKLTLPVQWPGELPAVSSVVRVTGSVEKRGFRKIFTASTLEVLEPPPGVVR